tara:strand:- start:1133 stop:2062 length:930 start_codon:yes stop_codon:yes gene_type:complete
MKVVSYLKTVPGKNINPQKEQLLYDFATGVNTAGDDGIVHLTDNLIACDAAMLQGWVYQKITTPHLRLRNSIIQSQKEYAKHTITADANLFLFHDPKNSKEYLRYSFDGIFPTTGIYCDTTINDKRWQSISNNLNLIPAAYTNQGHHILLMCQRQGGWSMKGYDVLQWIVDTIIKVQSHTDRKIIIRSHPGDKLAVDYLANRPGHPLAVFSNIELSPPGRSLDEDLNGAWAVVNHNSSAAVGPIIKGYHCFLTDPQDSQCKEVSNQNFARLEDPHLFDRELWLKRISMFHWTFGELRSGECWKHMRQFI